ncbi:MAG TPA: ATP-binding protein [Saprospiraceae bacterium]|nr:ATP-binding protein [Saprospiraceae bacterium]
MTEAELQAYILEHYPQENAACEWKGWQNLRYNISGRKSEDLISYVSGIANMEGGVVIIGVEDANGRILGISDIGDYTAENLPFRLKGNCTNLNVEQMSVDEYITTDTQKIVWIIHVPKHQPRLPVYAHKQGWQRIGDNLVTLTAERKTIILQEPITLIEDWSREICEGATINDLSTAAILRARKNYATKFPHLASDLEDWDDITFLNKAKICIDGQITRTAILLLGLPESVHYLQSAQTQISWILKDRDNIELDYQHFPPPYLLQVEEVFQKVRNLRYRYMKGDSIFPEEVDMYDPYVMREALHNAIAHQDYTMSGRIFLVEFPDRLLFINDGSFIPGSVEAVIEKDAPNTQSRNPFLAQAMVNLGMIDTIGSGIKKMFITQRKRFFPMPDYEIEAHKVTVQVYGKVLDLEYARLLAQIPELSLREIILLDNIQKHKPISTQAATELRGKGYIEGRRPNYLISSNIAKVTGDKASYIKNRGFKDAHYKKMVMEYLDKYQKASRADITKLLFDILPGVLSEKQKDNKIRNILYAMSKREGTIENIGSSRKPIWVKTSN